MATAALASDHYETLSLSEVRKGLESIAREAEQSFGSLTAGPLNWRPDPKSWSVAQCFDHLITTTRLMLQAADAALSGTAPKTVWQRLPAVPGLLGRMLVRSQAPSTVRKFRAPAKAQPASSDIDAAIIQRFVEQRGAAVRRLQDVNERDVARTIMTSPFLRVITYSVLDGWRLVLAHDRRHFEQARRVTSWVGFPRG